MRWFLGKYILLRLYFLSVKKMKTCTDAFKEERYYLLITYLSCVYCVIKLMLFDIFFFIYLIIFFDKNIMAIVQNSILCFFKYYLKHNKYQNIWTWESKKFFYILLSYIKIYHEGTLKILMLCKIERMYGKYGKYILSILFKETVQTK